MDWKIGKHIKNLAFFLLIFSSLAHAGQITLGVLNTIGDETDSKFFKETEQYLKKNFKKDSIVIKKYDLPGLEKAIRNKDLNFFISNPGFYASTQGELNTTILASMNTVNSGHPDRALGSVFVALADDDTINSFEEMRGKVACAVAPSAYGGLYVAYGELLKRKTDPELFFNHIVYTGYPMPKVFSFLKEEQCEVGIVRTCLYEDLIKRKEINPADFKIIGAKKKLKDFSCTRSTDLYPGWVLAATSNTSNNLKKEVIQILFGMPEIEGNSWTVPGNYSQVEALYRDLKVGHYEYLREWSWQEFLKQYWQVLIILGFLVIAALSYTKLLQTQVKRKTRKLEQALVDKEIEHKKVEAAKQDLADLEKVSMMGMLSSMVAHELRQPLSVIRNYCEGLQSMAEGKEIDPQAARQVVEIIDGQAEKASSIIEHIRSLVKGKDTHIQEVNLKKFVPQVVESFYRLGGGIPVEIKIKLSNLGTVHVDPIQLEIVLLNLLNNAAEAIRQQNTTRKIKLMCKEDGDFYSVCVINEGVIQGTGELNDLFTIKHSSKKSGLGLGLAICARILESYGGVLNIEARDNKVYACLKIPRDKNDNQ